MNVNFEYDKKKIDFISGYLIKGKSYRCSFIRYKTLYKNPAPGAETVELYNFSPKGEVKASSFIVHGLGSRNIKFLLWLGPHLASVGVNTSILILPGNYTRVENNSVSGKSFLYPDMDLMYQFWEHAVVDIRSSLDLLEQNGMWVENNILMGYCLGGMISSIVSALEKDRIRHTMFMTTGGHIPKILHESPVTGFVKRMVDEGKKADYNLLDQDKIYKTYEEQLPLVEQMTLEELINSDEIHPLLKIDPISYAHLLDKSKITFVDAFFDSTLPLESRKSLYDRMEGGKRRVWPISHVNWLPFAYLIAKYILHKVNINDKESRKSLLKSEKMDNPFGK